MRRIYTYILALLALSVACQRVDLPVDSLVNLPAELPTGAIGSKATITFSTADLMGLETRGVVQPKAEIDSLHLIVFDENGMLVEVCPATELGNSDHVDPETGEVHKGGRHYTVTLTLTDEPRIIHYVANCPVDQVEYGHETSIIGNMFVDRNGSEGAQTTYETSYWARIEVPYILVKKDTINGTIVESLVDDIVGKFNHVPLLRNYAEITVTDMTNDTFYFEGFTVYNLLNRGTVAPYNSTTREFQSFFTYTESETPEIRNYSYPEISKEFGYEGHALTSAQLITDFIRDDKGDVKVYKSNEPFYVYERKVSVMTDEEEKWRESPPHIIIKGKYDNGAVIDKTKLNEYQSYYYKMDLVYTETDASGFEEIKYYNILRNFMYQFNLTAVHDEGYTSLDAAVAGAAGNNLSGSSSTSKLTNVSDNEGRLWVSYTDTTLVSNNAVSLKYKYVPNYYESPNNVQNGQVRFENIEGDVITKIEIDGNDIVDGAWAGYRNVTVYVKDPDAITRQQALQLKTNSAHLNRQIRYTLRKKLTMAVECTPKVRSNILEPVTVDIKLPPLTEDMFPLMLNMETYDRTLSPDALNNGETGIPVTAGKSIINGRREELSYYYTVTIPTLDAYKALPNDGNMKVYHTYWKTNMADNADTIYVDNKYFKQASDNWQNYQYVFSDASCSSSAVGVGENVTINFTMADNAINKEVTISLVGMTYNGATEVKYTPTKKNVSLTCMTTTATDPVSFTLDADEYNILGPVEGTRLTYKFNGAFVDVTSLEAEKDVEVDFTFNISADAFDALNSLYPDAGDAGVPMYVTLDRMHPADDQLVYSQAKAEGDRYIYRIKQAGTQTIKLATTEDVGGTCAVTLQADYFDTETKEINQIGRDFRSLNITNNRIAQGLGRSVNITFQLATGEGNNAQKDVTVTLVNMAVNGKNTITFNTGDSNAVTNNNGTYTIKNVVTADDPAGELKVTITAKGYSSKEATFTKERPIPKFTTSLSKTNLGASDGEEVVLSFSSEDLVDGMDVTLELDGLRPKDDLPTRAVTRYVYTVNGTGTQNITLVTTGSTTTSKTCYVQLKAEEFGFEDSQILSVVQSNAVTYSGKNKNVTYSINRPEVSGGNWWDNSTYSATINSIKVDGAQVDYNGSAAYTYSYNPGTLTVTLNSISITGSDLRFDTNINFECTVTHKKGNATATTTAKFTKTIGDLGLTLPN